MRTHVAEVETNLKVGAQVKLGERTLILGKNRAGKSTIVNAIEAAGSGVVSDVAGRATLAKDADLSMLGSSEKLFAKVILSDGGKASWGLSKGHRAVKTGEEISFPLRAAREALLGSPDKARRWILQNGGGIDWDDVVDLVPEALRPKLRSIVWDATEGDDPAIRLAKAIDESKRFVREANAKAKARPAAPAGPVPTDKEIREAEALVASLASGNQDRLADTRATIEELGRRIQAAEKAEAEAIAGLSALPPGTVTEGMRAALSVVEMLASAKASQCAICASKVDPSVFITRALFARKALDAGLRAAEIRGKLTATLTQAQRELAEYRPRRVNLETEEKKLAAMMPVTVADPVAARNTLEALHQRKAAWAAVRAAETEALQAEQDALAWGQLADALSKALGVLVERARVAFEARVQAFLPAGWIFGVDLLDGEREVLRVGLRDGGALRAAMSGAEWATVTAALALATAPADGPVVIAPEERAFDPETLVEVMESFGSSGAQVILTSPTPPERVPEGWTVINVGRAVEFTRAAPALREATPAATPPIVRKKNGPKTEPVKKPAEDLDDIFGS